MTDLSQGIAIVETLAAERDLYKRRLANSEECRDNLFAAIQRLHAALRPFCEADWYADGFGKFLGKITGDDLDRAKAALGQSRDD